MASKEEHCCFNCDALGGGYYKPHEDETTWYLGLDATGQANYACEECHPLLFNARPIKSRAAIAKAEQVKP